MFSLPKDSLGKVPDKTLLTEAGKKNSQKVSLFKYTLFLFYLKIV